MKQTTRNLTINALLLALICVLSYLNIPLPFISGAITGTTLALCLVALIRPPKDTLIIIVIYLFMGAIGLPVFAGGGGFAKFIGPAAGYYISWPFAFPLLSYSLQKKQNIWHKYFLTLVITIPVIYGMGAVGLILTTKMGIVPAFLGQIVYLPGDTIKYLIAIIIAKRLEFVYT